VAYLCQHTNDGSIYCPWFWHGCWLHGRAAVQMAASCRADLRQSSSSCGARPKKVVISVLMKLAGGCPSLADQLNVDAFLEQARSYDKAASNPVGWYIRNAQTRELSHPLPVMRAREIDEWSRSQEYKTLMQKLLQMGLNRV